MKSLKKSSLIAPCGMNCGVCMAHLRERNTCAGCRANRIGKPVTRVRCKIKTCEFFQKTNARFCFQCDELPCDALNHLDKRYRTKYGMSMIENLQNIKSLGIQQFVANEKVRWACPECGATICVHTRTCNSCKQQINKEQYYENT